MKIYKPLFSLVLILIQLILSVVRYFDLQNWRKENPELDALISLNITYTTLFIFVLIIGIYEIMTKPSWFKTAIRIFLVCIILGTTFSNFIPIEDFYFGVYNTAWFSAVVAFVLILVRIGKYGIEKWNN
ncbi:hypothetical protein [Winogradskyella helgolandensis]|uniref:hypothetical protein n=1 Tax=Winogradskyella helgolandensis TaxID=2697010 RepID=UPI0015BB9A07|nr:hypothetical protein [Winogradskyella helgolandensis]